MSRDRRVFFWLLLGCGIALSVGWLFYVPYCPGRLVRFIPARATWMNTHHQLASRLDDWSQGPLAAGLLKGAGLDPAVLRKQWEDQQFQRLVHQLVGREVTCAYLPPVGYQGQPAWAFASWVGGRSLILRGQLKFGQHPQLESRAGTGGRSYWVWKSGEVNSSPPVSFALEEGVIYGCVSDNPAAMNDLIHVSEGRRPSAADLLKWQDRLPGISRESAPDHGWINLSGQPFARKLEYPVLGYELTRMDGRGLAGRLCSLDRFSDADSDPIRMDSAALGRLLGEVPAAFSVMNSGPAKGLLRAVVSRDLAMIVEETIDQFKGRPIGLAITGGDFSGRYLEMKVPALLLAVPVTPEDDSPAVLQRMLDQLNARFRWGLFPHEVPAGDRVLYAVESSNQSPYARLAVAEKPAYAICDQWLLVSSSLKSLMELIARYDRSEAMAGAKAGRWSRNLDAASLYAWFNLPEFSKAFRTVAKLYLVKQQLSEGKAADRIKNKLYASMAWMDALAVFPQGEIWFTPNPQETELRFRMGEPDESIR